MEYIVEVSPGAERAIRNEVLRAAMAQWAEWEAVFAPRNGAGPAAQDLPPGGTLIAP